MVNKSSLPYWAIIPAAGAGKRMQSHIPKQYLPFAGKTVLQHTLSIFINHPLIAGIVVSISDGDEYWPDVLAEIKSSSNKSILVAKGGKERQDSVLSALYLLQDNIKQNAWVLVHDAARPCLLACEIDNLISTIKPIDIGGLLAVPISDTLKRAVKIKNNEQIRVEKTVNRENIWRALTPQQFKLYTLIKALELNQDKQITDESSAIELLNLKPALIKGNANNIKITHPSDLKQAEQIFYNQKG